MKVVLQSLTLNFNENCASDPDLELHHVNFVTKLMYALNKPKHFTAVFVLIFCTYLPESQI